MKIYHVVARQGFSGSSPVEVQARSPKEAGMKVIKSYGFKVTAKNVYETDCFESGARISVVVQEVGEGVVHYYAC